MYKRSKLHGQIGLERNDVGNYTAAMATRLKDEERKQIDFFDHNKNAIR